MNRTKYIGMDVQLSKWGSKSTSRTWALSFLREVLIGRDFHFVIRAEGILDQFPSSRRPFDLRWLLKGRTCPPQNRNLRTPSA